MEPLKTLKGSRIWYSKFGVGKQVGSKIYFHKSVWDKIVPKDIWEAALSVMDGEKIHNDLWEKMGLNECEYETVCYDLNKPAIIRFDTCVEFDTAREPRVGIMIFVNTNDGSIKIKHNQQIYHHKWLWVNEDYQGFDVQKSYEWSKLWLSKFEETASGYRHKWKEQLKKYNLV